MKKLFKFLVIDPNRKYDSIQEPWRFLVLLLVLIPIYWLQSFMGAYFFIPFCMLIVWRMLAFNCYKFFKD